MVYKLVTLALLCSTVCVQAGAVAPRISGGVELTTETRKDFNYIVYVISAKISFASTTLRRCTGVVLNENFILTAADCLLDGTENTTVVLVPAENITTKFEITASKFYKHDDFNETNLVNDIGLIKLEKSLTLNENVNKIDIDTSAPAENDSCTVAGFGASSRFDENMYLSGTPAYLDNVIVKADTTCNAAPVQLCAGAEGTKTLCVGDVGAPLVCNKKFVAIAVTGNNCEKTNAVDKYVELKDVRSWIYDTINSAPVGLVLSPLALLSTLAVILKMNF